MQFIKMHGLGNDFIIAPAFEQSIDYRAAARFLCDRNKGIGGDGIILVSLIQGQTISISPVPSFPLEVQGLTYNIRIFNPDGTEAETCGNGIRCVAKYLRDNKVIDDEFCIATPFRTHKVKCYLGNNEVSLVTVGMGKPEWKRFDHTWKDSQSPQISEIKVSAIDEFKTIIKLLPTSEGQSFSGYFVSLGNPHFVIFLDKPLVSYNKEWFNLWGKSLSLSPVFSAKRDFINGCNIEFVECINKNRIKVVVYERGAGLTLACGSGAAASSVVAIALEKANTSVDVELPGGELKVEWGREEEILLTGPATEVFTGEISVEDFR